MYDSSKMSLYLVCAGEVNQQTRRFRKILGPNDVRVTPISGFVSGVNLPFSGLQYNNNNLQYTSNIQCLSNPEYTYIPNDANAINSSLQTNRLYSSDQTNFLSGGFNNNNLEFDDINTGCVIKYDLDQEYFEEERKYEEFCALPSYTSSSSGFCPRYLDEFENHKVNHSGVPNVENYTSSWSYLTTNSIEIKPLVLFEQTNTENMSGGPPHSHRRQAPSPNTAWNHLQVPNYYPRQPQHAHMANEHSILHQPTWHTPTTEPIKPSSHSHVYTLEQTVTERSYTQHSPGIDLTLQRNGNQNGELPITPISLSLRDKNKINSLPAGAIQTVGLTKSPSFKSGSLVVKPVASLCKLNSSTSLPSSTSPSVIEKLDSPKNFKRIPKSMDSIIERLNPAGENKSIETSVIISERASNILPLEKNNQIKLEVKEILTQSSVIVQPSSTTNIHDESSNSSSILNVPTPTNARDEDVVSPFSNEDSTDSNKSRRKRKPLKTVRLSKGTDRLIEHNYIDDYEKINNNQNPYLESDGLLEQRRAESAPPGVLPAAHIRGRRKTSSESETIANIAAMIERTTASKSVQEPILIEDDFKPISVSVIKSKDNAVGMLPNVSIPATKVPTPAQKKLTESKTFVEVENQLEEMFAGISDDTGESPRESKMSGFSKKASLEVKSDDNVVINLEENNIATNLQESVTSTSNDLSSSQGSQKRTRKKASKLRYSTESLSEETTPKRRKGNKKTKSFEEYSEKPHMKKIKTKLLLSRSDITREVNAYDSGSNASSIKSRGPFLHIQGPRESPLSVHIVNTPSNEDDIEKKSSKSKKYHDDGEYRHKVRSRGLHCSTLSNKYDSQTRDATWICVFCKLGPHGSNGKSIGNNSLLSPGDLFGPYVITSNAPEYARHLDDPYDKQFRSKKVARAVIDTTNNKISIKKSKRKHSDSLDSRSSSDKNDSGTVDVYLGMIETAAKSFEVWAHEDCIVWAPGVYLVGPKIIGLEEAVWSACNVLCNKCHYRGANVCCAKRGCMSVMHFGCASTSDWYLDKDTFKVFCELHKSS